MHKTYYQKLMQISSTISYIQTCRQQNCQFFALTGNGCECSAQKGRGSGLQHQNYLFQIVFELNQPGVRNDRLVVNLTPMAAAGAVTAAKLCLVLLLTPALPYQRRPGPPTSNLSRLRHDSYVESTELPTFARFNSISLA